MRCERGIEHEYEHEYEYDCEHEHAAEGGAWVGGSSVKIYTKTGDGGETGLFDGSRVPKHDARVDAYGEVDETNAAIGAARAFVEDAEIAGMLTSIQRDLFAVGAQLADPKYGQRAAKDKTVITEGRVAEFEQWMDRFDAQLPPLKGFILPCGTKAGALLHLARCVCRRAERKITALATSIPIPPIVVVYVNRLSDLLFVLARVANQRGGEEQVPW